MRSNIRIEVRGQFERILKMTLETIIHTKVNAKLPNPISSCPIVAIVKPMISTVKNFTVQVKAERKLVLALF
jgi:hypothetical protein